MADSPLVVDLMMSPATGSDQEGLNRRQVGKRETALKKELVSISTVCYLTLCEYLELSFIQGFLLQG